MNQTHRAMTRLLMSSVIAVAGSALLRAQGPYMLLGVAMITLAILNVVVVRPHR